MENYAMSRQNIHPWSNTSSHWGNHVSYFSPYVHFIVDLSYTSWYFCYKYLKKFTQTKNIGKSWFYFLIRGWDSRLLYFCCLRRRLIFLLLYLMKLVFSDSEMSSSSVPIFSQRSTLLQPPNTMAALSVSTPSLMAWPGQFLFYKRGQYSSSFQFPRVFWSFLLDTPPRPC